MIKWLLLALAFAAAFFVGDALGELRGFQNGIETQKIISYDCYEIGRGEEGNILYFVAEEPINKIVLEDGQNVVIYKEAKRI